MESALIAGDRRARRHGQSQRRRRDHDRRHRVMRELGFSSVFGEIRSDAVPHAGVRLRHGADHDLAAARPRLDARAIAFLQASKTIVRPLIASEGTAA